MGDNRVVRIRGWRQDVRGPRGRGAALRLGATVAAALAFSTCGGGPGPSPSPSPSAPDIVPGGTVRGRYTLRLEPAAGCTTPAAAFSFPVTAEPADTPRTPAVQALLDGPVPSALELELRYETPTLRGGIGTTGDGVASTEGFRVWVRGIGAGAVATTRPATTGEVSQGTLAGSLAFGRLGDEEGALGTCTSTVHRWSLKLR